MRYTRRKKTYQLMMCIFASGLSASLFAADDYLSQIEAESGKVEADQATTGDLVKPSNSADSAAGANNTNNSVGRAEFEQMLDKDYHGSYVFYMKLPQRSKEEIFQEYDKGAPIAVIRKKIIDRFMKR